MTLNLPELGKRRNTLKSEIVLVQKTERCTNTSIDKDIDIYT